MRWPAELSKPLTSLLDRVRFRHQLLNVSLAAVGWSGAISLHIENCCMRIERDCADVLRYVPAESIFVVEKTVALQRINTFREEMDVKGRCGKGKGGYS